MSAVVTGDVEDFGQETLSQASQPEDKVKLTKVSPKDVFNLGKWVLIVVSALLLFFSICRMLCDDSEGVKDVWEFNKVFLNSVTTLILGYYFGQREKQSD